MGDRVVRTAPPPRGDPSIKADPKQPLRLTQGNTAKERARGRRARRVFHGTLAAELEERGAATVEELYLRFDCFLLPLERQEIKQVLESARREGLVAEVPDERDGYGEQVTEQWTTTEKGRKRGRPRTLALPDLGYLIIGEHDRMVKAFDMVKTGATVAIPGLALFGIDQLAPSDTTKWVAFAAAGAAILSVIAYGLSGELDLRAAAASWPRLEEVRPDRCAYQKSWPCMVSVPAFIAAVYAAAGLWLGLGFFDWWVYAVAAVLTGVFYLWRVFPMYRAWHRIDPGRCRTEWTRRGNLAAGRPRCSCTQDEGDLGLGEAAQGEPGERAVGEDEDRQVQ
jgi:hypothetical protein